MMKKVDATGFTIRQRINMITVYSIIIITDTATKESSHLYSAIMIMKVAAAADATQIARFLDTGVN